jgi:hypothetical protein
MDDGSSRAAIVALEVTAIPMADELIKAIAQQIGVREFECNARRQHTPTAFLCLASRARIPLNVKDGKSSYRTGAPEAVSLANQSPRSARISFGRGGLVNVNTGEQSVSRLGYHPHGPSDKTLDVAGLESFEGSQIAIVVNYESQAEVCSAVSHRITATRGVAICLSRFAHPRNGIQHSASGTLTSGAGADQLTLFKSLQPASRLPAADAGAAGWTLLNVQALILAESVMEVVGTMKSGTSRVRIESASSSLTCPNSSIGSILRTVSDGPTQKAGCDSSVDDQD